MPEKSEQIQSMLDRLRDIGQPSLGLAGAMLLLVLILLLLGIRNPGASTWCRRLLSISAALAYAINLIIASSYRSMLFEVQARAGVDPATLAADHAMIEYHTILFHVVSALALVAAAVLVSLEWRQSSAPSTPTLTPPRITYSSQARYLPLCLATNNRPSPAPPPSREPRSTPAKRSP